MYTWPDVYPHFNSISMNNEASQHANIMLMDEESLYPVSYKSGVSDSDQGTTNDSHQLKHSDLNPDNSCSSLVDSCESLVVVDYDVNTTSFPVAHANANVVLAESSNGKKDNIVLVSQNRINPDDTVKGTLSLISQEESRVNDVASVPKMLTRRKELKSSASMDVTHHNSLRCKMSMVFAICCVIGCWLIPVILYYASQATDRDNVVTDPGYSHEKNVSSAMITLMRTCSFSASDSDHVDQILYTYEALRTINLPSSQQYCSERVETLFCDALMECSNESYVKDIVCQQVRQEYCTAEWRMLELRNQTDGLIDCEENEETAPLNCGDQFDLANDGSACLLLCGEFSQYSEAYTTPHVVLSAVCWLMSVIGGLTVIAISFKKRKKMFCFPQVLIVINAGMVATVHFLNAIPPVTVGRWNILCSRKFLYDALENPTAFCAMQALLNSSVGILYCYFWLLYVFHLALKIFYPLKSAELFNSRYSRAIYIVAVLSGFFIATAPLIINAGLSNYEIVTFPPIQCGNSSRSYLFYASIVPIMTTICVSMILMLLTLYKIHVNYGIFKTKREGAFGKQVCTCKFTVPEVKIIIVLSYWVVHAVLVYGALSIRTGRDDTFNYYLRSYTDCMAGGNRRDHDCHSLRLDIESETNPVVDVNSRLLYGFLNFVSLSFVIQFRTIKNLVEKAARKFNTKNTKHTNNNELVMRQQTDPPYILHN